MFAVFDDAESQPQGEVVQVSARTEYAEGDNPYGHILAQVLEVCIATQHQQTLKIFQESQARLQLQDYNAAPQFVFNPDDGSRGG